MSKIKTQIKKMIRTVPVVQRYVDQKNSVISHLEQKIIDLSAEVEQKQYRIEDLNVQSLRDKDRYESLVSQNENLTVQNESLMVQLDQEKKLNGAFPPGHYYSPIASMDEIRADAHRIFADRDYDDLPGIDFNIAEQKELIRVFQELAKEAPFPETQSESFRYYYENDFFAYKDAIVLFCFLRYLAPKKMIEVGSGFSSAVILDTNERFFSNKIHCTFIEPYPERLYSLLNETDEQNCHVCIERVQNVDLSVFTELNAGDILLIDSSHVSKAGSDVNFILFEVLPVLKNGVFIHFHDIIFPFEIPKDWVYEGRNWNETYILRAFLEYNNRYRVKFFGNFLAQFAKHEYFSAIPAMKGTNGGCSLWLEKV